MQTDSRLQHFPVAIFSMVMGLAGLTIAWDKTLLVLGGTDTVHLVLTAITGLVFLMLFVIYLSKILRFRQVVAEELRHPVKLNFFPAISISLILLSIITLSLSPALSKVLWMSGSSLQLMLLLYVMNIWIHHEHFEIVHLNPAWFIPAVGNVLVPISGVAHGFTEISWFFFSVGILFWLVLLSIIFNRILFHHPLPGKLMPTLFILIAPPAVGFISYVKLTGGVDAFAHMLYYIALFFTLLLLTQVTRFVRLPFFLSWWAYSFPLAAITVASWLMYEHSGLAMIRWIALLLLGLLSLVVIVLLVKTMQAASHGKICVPE